MSWQPGQVPQYVWLPRNPKEGVGADRRGKWGGSRLLVGKVKCWTMEPPEPHKWACYRLVPSKSRRKKK